MQTNSIYTNKKLLAKYKIPFIILLILSSIGGLCALISCIASIYVYVLHYLEWLAMDFTEQRAWFAVQKLNE